MGVRPRVHPPGYTLPPGHLAASEAQFGHLADGAQARMPDYAGGGGRWVHGYYGMEELAGTQVLRMGELAGTQVHQVVRDRGGPR